MDLNQLKTFVTVAEENHLTRAAERLFTSQPAVSAQLKALEESLGVNLFERTSKGMKLTPAGAKLLAQAKATLDSAALLSAQAKEIQGHLYGELKIGVNSDYGFLRVPAITTRSNKNNKNIDLTFINSISPDILNSIRKGAMDGGFFFGSCEFADLLIEPLADIPSAVLAPIDWSEEIKSASRETLAKMPWVYATQECPFVPIVESFLQGTSENLNKVVLVDNEDAIREFVREGAGIALLRADDAAKAEQEGWGVRWRNGTTPPIKLSVAVQKKRQQEPLIKYWLELARSTWSKEGSGSIENLQNNTLVS